VNHTVLIRFDWNLKYRIVSSSSFVDLRWGISLPYTSKAWLTWKYLVQLFAIGGRLHWFPPWLRACPQSWNLVWVHNTGKMQLYKLTVTTQFIKERWLYPIFANRRNVQSKCTRRFRETCFCRVNLAYCSWFLPSGGDWVFGFFKWK